MKYRDRLSSNIRASILAKQALLENESLLRTFENAVACLVAAFRNGGRLYIAGNGGSAADAQHLAAEFISKLAVPRAPLPAEALTTDTSIVTAIGNDFGFEQIFARQLEGKATEKDVFLAITTSGQSPNILRGLEVCRKLKVTSILLGGRDGGSAKDLADHCLIVPGEDTSRIQELHLVLYHTLCGCVEEALFPVTANIEAKHSAARPQTYSA